LTLAMAQLVRTLVEAPTRLQEYIDNCACGRSDKAAANAIKKELEAKDAAIERLEEEIRRKDAEKDNLVHMQKDLQAQIEEVKRVLDSHAQTTGAFPSDQTKAAVRVQSRYRGIHGRQQVSHKRMEAGKRSRALVDRQQRSAQLLQARIRGKSTRRLVQKRHQLGDLPGQRRPPPTSGEANQMVGTLGSVASYDDGDSVDSDYDNDDFDFSNLGHEVLAGELELAKVYGQEDPPAAEDELQWECRYFILFDSCICHFDALEHGLPVGDRGIIYLKNITTVEKVLASPTFVMKGANKVYLFRLPSPDEVMMRTWIAKISQELKEK